MSRPVAVLLCCVLLASASIAAAAPAAVLGEAPALGWVLLAGPGPGMLRVFDVRRGVTPLATLPAAGRGQVIAVQVEVARRRVWVLATSGLDVHDGFSGRLLGHWAAPAGVALERLDTDPAGRPQVASGSRRFEAVAGAAELLPAPLRMTMR